MCVRVCVWGAGIDLGRFALWAVRFMGGFLSVRHNVTAHFAFHVCPLQKDGVQ